MAQFQRLGLFFSVSSNLMSQAFIFVLLPAVEPSHYQHVTSKIEAEKH